MRDEITHPPPIRPDEVILISLSLSINGGCVVEGLCECVCAFFFI